jgi:predicted dehydrogenase
MLSFAIVGCGRISIRHSDLLGKNLIPEAKLVSTCDLDLKKCKELGIRHSVPYYQDMHIMMKKEKIDVVVVLTESGNHAKNVIDLSRYGKHIIVEKPIALKLEDADKMISACERNSIKLFVVKQNRFNLPVIELKKAFDNNRFGKINLATIRVRWCRDQKYYDQDKWRGTWLMDGGALANQASHHIDLLNWLMGDIESLYAKSITSLVKIEAEDTAVAVLKFKNGALGIIEVTMATRPKDLEGSISILGEKGTVEIGGFALNKIKHWNFLDSNEQDKKVLKESNENPPNVYGFGHKAFYDHIIDHLKNGTKCIAEAYSAKKTLHLINLIYESIETKKEVNYDQKIIYSKLGK